MKYIAAIDVGSYEISMTVAQLRQQKEARVLERVSRTVAAGSDTYTTGAISPQVCKQIIEVLSGFKRKLAEYPDCYVLAAATSAIREASNRSFVLDQIKSETGIQVRVLSNNEENSYHLSSLAERCENFAQISRETTLILELGAGSIQLSLYDEGHFLTGQNMKLGSLRLRELLSELSEHSREFSTLMSEYISGDLAYYKNFESHVEQVKHLIISGGGLEFLRQLAGLPAVGQTELSLAAFHAFFEKLQKMSLRELVVKENIPAESASLLLPTAILTKEIFALTNLDKAILPVARLEDGLLIEAAERWSRFKPSRDARADRISAARELAKRYRTDREHCEQVEVLSLELFDRLTKLHGLDEKAREYLQIACILHNIGKYISMQNDDLRSYEIVSSAEIPGLSEEETELISMLVFYHNGKIDSNDDLFTRLGEEKAVLVCKLASIMAIANALDASHKQKISKIKVKTEEREVVLTAFSQENITLELWTVKRHTRLFEAVFGYTVNCRYKDENVL